MLKEHKKVEVNGEVTDTLFRVLGYPLKEPVSTICLVKYQLSHDRARVRHAWHHVNTLFEVLV
jgi:hypothetical protein